MAEVKTKKRRGKRSRQVTPEQVKKIMDSKPTPKEEAVKEEKGCSTKKTVETKHEALDKVFMVKKYSKDAEAKIIGFLNEEEEAKAFCKMQDKLEGREGVYVYEPLMMIDSNVEKTKPYYQHQVRFMIRNELNDTSSNHFKYDGDMCIEPNNYIKFIGVKHPDDVLLFHNKYITTLSVRTVQESREQAEKYAREIYDRYLMYYRMTNCYLKAHKLLLAKMGIKESDAVIF